MKKTVSILMVLFVVSAFVPQLLYAQQQSGPPGQGWYCPCWRTGGGCGMMGRGRGRDMGPAARLSGGKPLTEDQARFLLQRYIGSSDVAGLKLGEVSDKGDVFEAVITNKGGAPVEKIQVDKKTGWFRNISS